MSDTTGVHSCILSKQICSKTVAGGFQCSVHTLVLLTIIATRCSQTQDADKQTL